ncbi:MAG TPA: hypothetical protein VGW34_09550 [Allosphingosinicella sp.]|nr:hypothetical protein [Allosphingosinicella sp.]
MADQSDTISDRMLQDGARLLAVLPKGSTVRAARPDLGGWIVDHPDHPPRLLTVDGALRPLPEAADG